MTGWLLSLPYRFVACFGWPGLAAAVCAAALAFQFLKRSAQSARGLQDATPIFLLKPSAKPARAILAAPILALAVLAIWWFRPGAPASEDGQATGSGNPPALTQKTQEYRSLIARRQQRRRALAAWQRAHGW